MNVVKKIYLVLFFVLACLTGLSYAETAFQGIYLQGYLTDAAGNPLNGSYAATISIYNVETGGTALTSATYTLTVTNGAFYLGEPTSGWSGEGGSELFNGQVLYYGILLSGETAELSPRTEVVCTPYAFTAQNVTGESVYVKNEGAQKMAIYAQNTQGTAIYARGGAGAGIVGSSESSNGYGLEGHAYGASGIGARGQGQHENAWAVEGVNTDSIDSTVGGALYVVGKMFIENSTDEASACAGSGMITVGETNTPISNDVVTSNSMIFLVVTQDTANTNGGIRVNNITDATSFRVATMDGNNASSNIGFRYLIIN